jgi:rare lipoprotein A
MRALIVVAACALTACATTTMHERSTITEQRTDVDHADVVSHQAGLASWYGREQHGHLTANGEHFDMYALTAAHKTLHMNTRVRVTRRDNGRSVVVRINDRGPYSHARIIDLSYAAAKQLDMLDRGVAPVLIEVLR